MGKAHPPHPVDDFEGIECDASVAHTGFDMRAAARAGLDPVDDRGRAVDDVERIDPRPESQSVATGQRDFPVNHAQGGDLGDVAEAGELFKSFLRGAGEPLRPTPLRTGVIVESVPNPTLRSWPSSLTDPRRNFRSV
jgi:hypothetical protein